MRRRPTHVVRRLAKALIPSSSNFIALHRKNFIDQDCEREVRILLKKHNIKKDVKLFKAVYVEDLLLSDLSKFWRPKKSHRPLNIVDDHPHGNYAQHDMTYYMFKSDEGEDRMIAAIWYPDAPSDRDIYWYYPAMRLVDDVLHWSVHVDLTPGKMGFRSHS
jgi:hypothetical protein